MRCALKPVVFAIAVLLSASPPALADFVPISDEATFIESVQGKTLNIGLLGIRLSIFEDGRIAGRAVGADVSGEWTWEEGFFCRTMDWSGYEIDYNCQLVEIRGTDRMRFTVDRGEGESATFSLR